MNKFVNEFVFRRSTWRSWSILALSVVAITLTLFTHVMATDVKSFEGRTIHFSFISGPKFWLLMALWGAGAVWSIANLLAARRTIVINSFGISDSVDAAIDPIPWSRIMDLDLVGTERSGYQLRLTLRTEQGVTTKEIDLEGIDPGPEGVFQIALENWNTSR